jgi:hypothetical protein
MRKAGTVLAALVGAALLTMIAAPSSVAMEKPSSGFHQATVCRPPPCP